MVLVKDRGRVQGRPRGTPAWPEPIISIFCNEGFLMVRLSRYIKETEMVRKLGAGQPYKGMEVEKASGKIEQDKHRGPVFWVLRSS